MSSDCQESPLGIVSSMKPFHTLSIADLSAYPPFDNPPTVKIIPPLSQAEVEYAKALAALDISLEFIRKTTITGRVTNDGNMKAQDRKRLDTEVEAVIDQLKKGRSQGETARTVAENLSTKIGAWEIERGVRYDLVEGGKKALGNLVKDKRAYEEWKQCESDRAYQISEDGEVIPPAKSAMYRAYEVEVKHINP